MSTIDKLTETYIRGRELPYCWMYNGVHVCIWFVEETGTFFAKVGDELLAKQKLSLLKLLVKERCRK